MQPRKNLQFPHGKEFAFSIVDDTDLATVDSVNPVYELLHNLGFKTTKTVWVQKNSAADCFSARSQTLQDESYLKFVVELQQRGFEIAMHLASPGNSRRSETESAYETFREIFGHYPKINVNHASNVEGIYWGRDRLDGPLLQSLYKKLLGEKRFRGHIEDSAFFWGDLCRSRTKYVRGFTFKDMNTLRINPGMPYHDPRRPYVNYWFSASDGADVERFNKLLAEKNQEQLLQEQGCCIVYTHFGAGFMTKGRLNPQTIHLLKTLAHMLNAKK